MGCFNSLICRIKMLVVWILKHISLVDCGISVTHKRAGQRLRHPGSAWTLALSTSPTPLTQVRLPLTWTGQGCLARAEVIYG